MPIKPTCEMCGKEAPLVKAEIEGGELEVCHNCSKFGKVKSYVRIPSESNSNWKKKTVPKEVIEESVVHNYATILRSFREKNKLSQEDFARLLNEKESVVAKWESGSLKPSVETARKLEKIMGLKLVSLEEFENYKEDGKKRGDVLTLGDFVKVRKRK